MECKININMDNEAFNNNAEMELKMIFDKIIMRLNKAGLESHRLYDYNGNTVGEINFIE